MSSIEAYIDRKIENRMNELHTVTLCKVESFDGTKLTAKLVPLFMTKYADSDVAVQQPPMMNVPVTKHKWIDKTVTPNVVHVEPLYLEQGDIVIVAFIERAIDMVLDGNIADPVYNRKHSQDDGIIIGIL